MNTRIKLKKFKYNLIERIIGDITTIIGVAFLVTVLNLPFIYYIPTFLVGYMIVDWVNRKIGIKSYQNLTVDKYLEEQMKLDGVQELTPEYKEEKRKELELMLTAKELEQLRNKEIILPNLPSNYISFELLLKVYGYKKSRNIKVLNTILYVMIIIGVQTYVSKLPDNIYYSYYSPVLWLYILVATLLIITKKNRKLENKLTIKAAVALTDVYYDLSTSTGTLKEDGLIRDEKEVFEAKITAIELGNKVKKEVDTKVMEKLFYTLDVYGFKRIEPYDLCRLYVFSNHTDQTELPDEIRNLDVNNLTKKQIQAVKMYDLEP